MTNFSTISMRIGKAALASGVSASSIRFYEQHGLLSPALRSENGYRTYTALDIERLRQIRTCRNLDMSLHEIQQLLGPSTATAEGGHMTTQILQEHLAHVLDRIAELESLENQLKNLIGLCSHPADVACPTLEAIKTPAPLTNSPTNNHLRHS